MMFMIFMLVFGEMPGIYGRPDGLVGILSCR